MYDGALNRGPIFDRGDQGLFSSLPRVPRDHAGPVSADIVRVGSFLTFLGVPRAREAHYDYDRHSLVPSSFEAVEVTHLNLAAGCLLSGQAGV